MQTLLIKAAQKTNYIWSALIYMQLKFHVNLDKVGDGGGEGGRGEEIKDTSGEESRCVQ